MVVAPILTGEIVMSWASYKKCEHRFPAVAKDKGILVRHNLIIEHRTIRIKRKRR